MSKSRYRNAYCSFCRKSYKEVGPLVEGPGDVYICGACIELCQAIIEQERQRRGLSAEGAASVPTAEELRGSLNRLVDGQDEAKEALVQAAVRHLQPTEHRLQSLLLLIGPTRSSRVFLAKALAHVLTAPFAQGDRSALVAAPGIPTEPLLCKLLQACDFDASKAQRGVVYVDGIDERATQEALLCLLDEERGESSFHDLQFDVGELLVICVS